MIETDHQQEILDLRRQGLDQYQIAHRLNVPLDQVERVIFGEVDADMIEFIHWGQHY